MNVKVRLEMLNKKRKFQEKKVQSIRFIGFNTVLITQTN